MLVKLLTWLVPLSIHQGKPRPDRNNIDHCVAELLIQLQLLLKFQNSREERCEESILYEKVLVEGNTSEVIIAVYRLKRLFCEETHSDEKSSRLSLGKENRSEVEGFQLVGGCRTKVLYSVSME